MFKSQKLNIFKSNNNQTIHPSSHETITVINSSSSVKTKERKKILAARRGWYDSSRIRLALMLYVFMAAHKAACQTLSKAVLKSMKTW